MSKSLANLIIGYLIAQASHWTKSLRRLETGVEMIDISEHASQKTYKLRKSAQLKLILMMAGNRRIKEGRLNPFKRRYGEFINTYQGGFYEKQNTE